MNIHNTSKFAVLACAIAAILAPTAKADFVFNLDLNVSTLVNNASGPFYLDFALTKGNSAPNNTVTISSFSFTGGSAIPWVSGNSNGLVTGDMIGAPIVLNENSSNPFAEIWQQFSATTTDIRFVVDSTQNLLGSQADEFAVSILDNTATNIPTTDTSHFTSYTMADLLIGGNNHVTDVVTYKSTAPADATAVASVPEPSSALALLGGAGMLLGLRRKRA
jgi:hypothetical protein